MTKIIQLNIIHHYKKIVLDENDFEHLEQVDKKYSYAIVGENGLYEYGQISKEYFFDYSAPFHCSTLITNAPNVDEVISIIKTTLNTQASNSNYEDSWVEVIDEIEQA